MTSQRVFYPLGHGTFASIKTYKQCVYLYLTRYRVTKTGRIVQSNRVGLSQKQFMQLLHIRDRLCQAYDREMTVLDQRQQKQQPKLSEPVKDTGFDIVTDGGDVYSDKVDVVVDTENKKKRKR